MRTKIVRIGNSRGVRIPKTLIEQCGLEDTVELDVEHGRLVIRAAEKSRRGWDEAFRRMAEQGEDQLLDRESSSQTDWDAAEWDW